MPGFSSSSTIPSRSFGLRFRLRRGLLEQFLLCDSTHSTSAIFFANSGSTLLQVDGDLGPASLPPDRGSSPRRCPAPASPHGPLGGTVLASVAGEQPHHPRIHADNPAPSPSGTTAMSTRLSLPAWWKAALPGRGR